MYLCLKEPDIRDVATAYNNLGIAWCALGDAKKAVENYEKSLYILRHFFNEDHPYIKMVKSNLEPVTQSGI